MAWSAPVEDRSIGTPEERLALIDQVIAITAEVPSANIVLLVPSHEVGVDLIHHIWYRIARHWDLARRVVYISQLQLGFRYETDPPPQQRVIRAVRTNARKGPPDERPTPTFRVHRL